MMGGRATKGKKGFQEIKQFHIRRWSLRKKKKEKKYSLKKKSEPSFMNGEKVVYFIQGERTRLIKIGYTNNIKERYKQLCNSSPDILNILGYMKGNVELEIRIHKLFNNERLHGEWFIPTRELCIFIRKKSHLNKLFISKMMIEQQLNRKHSMSGLKEIEEIREKLNSIERRFKIEKQIKENILPIIKSL